MELGELLISSDAGASLDAFKMSNWNYFEAIRSEKRVAKLEATHLEKAKELYTKILMLRPGNLYAANGAGLVLAEKGHFDVSKDIFTQVQEAASGSVFLQMPNVWVRSTVAELKNVVRAFSQLSAASSYHTHGFDEKKIETNLDAAKIHCEVAEREEQQNHQRLELARQVSLVEEARRKAEEQRKFQAERRKHEDELKQLRQQEEHFERVKEQWKSVSIPSTKRKERTQGEDDESGDGGRRRKNGGKRRRKEKKSKTRFEQEQEEEEAEMEDEHEEMDGEDVNPMNDQEDGEDRTRDNFVAADLEDSDAEEDVGAPSNRKRRAWSESDEEDDQPSEPNPNSSSGRDRENSAGSDEEARGDEEEANEE
ncbi:uncharacterized protein A4U43_C06F7480 [Asparagus officinalis]|uniref:Uncharacterized protein n=1 Tax=Asparagus officinalis TaxID=4686 RepID=A0A5P1EL55_ASPOF|nr:uncharacterized protein A4U43_C06F7480 [Asparagus officinalis]